MQCPCTCPDGHVGMHRHFRPSVHPVQIHDLSPVILRSRDQHRVLLEQPCGTRSDQRGGDHGTSRPAQGELVGREIEEQGEG